MAFRKLALLALVPLLFGSTPVRADSTGLFNTAAGSCGYRWRQVCAGYGQGVPVGLAYLTVEINCTATSPFVVDRTGVGCFLRGMTDNRIYLPTGPLFVYGNAAVVSNVGTVPFQGYRLCVGAGYSTAAGEFQPVQNHRCD